MAHLSYVRCLCITTTNRGDDGFTLKLLRLASKSNPLSQRRPLFGLFHHLVKLTIVSKSHIAQTRTYPKGGPYLKAWGLPDHETAEEWSLISQAMKLPNLQVLQACGLRVLEPERYSKEMTVAPNLRTILIKRSHLSWGCLDDLIQASPRVKHFSYDYAPSNHVWRLQYKHPRPPIDDEADAGIVYEWPFWRESKAARNLEILDLSFEMAEFKKPHRSCMSSRWHQLFELTQLRVLCLNKALLPRTSPDEVPMDLEDCISPTVERLHICGQLSKKSLNNYSLSISQQRNKSW